MASTSITSTATHLELALSYAALILADSNILITPEKLKILLQAAGIEDVAPVWTTLFAKALEGWNVIGLVTEVPAAEDAGEQEDGREFEDRGEDFGHPDDEPDPGLFE